MDFDEFLAKRGYIRGYNHDYQVAYNYGAESRQQEIDALQSQIDILKEERDLLQKRIDVLTFNREGFYGALGSQNSNEFLYEEDTSKGKL